MAPAISIAKTLSKALKACINTTTEGFTAVATECDTSRTLSLNSFDAIVEAASSGINWSPFAFQANTKDI